MTSEKLLQARRRIETAYSPEAVRQLGTRLAERLALHLRQVEQGQGPVLNWRAPEENIAAAHRTLDGDVPFSHGIGDGPAGGADGLVPRFEQLIETALSRCQNLHHPGYIGHQVPASIPIAGLFDALGSITNQVMAIYEMGPWASAVERALVERWGTRIGLQPGEFAGLITHGGSLANLTALLTARNVVLDDVWERGLATGTGESGVSEANERSASLSHASQTATPAPVLVAHSDAHYGVTRSAGILGLGTEQVLRVPLDDRRKMDPERLDELLVRLRSRGVPIIAVSACACATPIGAFDPLPEIADVCARHEVWLHVDAAHGGAVAFSERHRHLIDGLPRADSFICDAHKMLFVPALCAFVFYRNPKHRFETFRQDAPYLFDPSAPGMAEFDSGMVTIECTKRAAAYGLWGVWSLFGPELFGDIIDVTFATARRLYEKLEEAGDFEALHEPECNIVVFRYVPNAGPGRDLTDRELGELNRTIRRKLMESGEFYLVQTTLDGIGALRVTVMNPLTDETHLDRLLAAIRRTAEEILSQG
jgi:L-2,4-diaminobutyrate decarboxylase